MKMTFVRFVTENRLELNELKFQFVLSSKASGVYLTEKNELKLIGGKLKRKFTVPSKISQIITRAISSSMTISDTLIVYNSLKVTIINHITADINQCFTHFGSFLSIPYTN